MNCFQAILRKEEMFLENNFTPKPKTSKKTLKVMQSELLVVISFFCEANQLTLDTPQGDICTLIGRIAQFKIASSHFYRADLAKLQIHVSDCISDQISNCPVAFANLHGYVERMIPLLSDLYIQIENG